MQLNLGEALLHAAEEPLEPGDLQVRVQARLHQNAGAAQLHRLPDLYVNGVKVEDVSLSRHLALERPVEGAERAILSAEIRVIDVAVDDVGDHALRMEPAPQRVG